MAKVKILIIGGGFGGVKAALELVDHPNFQVTLISEDSDLRYYPTLYHMATGGRRANSSIPLSNIFADKNIQIVRASATNIDRRRQVVKTNQEEHDYDKLILALGVVTNYFGIPGLDKYSYSIKSQAEAERFKKHLHDQLIDEKKPDLNYVIVGAGPTGIELAGALPGYLRYIMANHGVEHRQIHIDLIEALPRLLPSFPKSTSKLVKRRLKRLGVRLYLGKAVQGETADELTVSGKPIRSHTVVWTAGVTNHPFFKSNGFVIRGHGKVAIDQYLQAEDNIFVIGDNADTPYSGMAQTALHDGMFVAQNLIRQSRGKPMNPYNAKKPITVIPVGEYWAAVIWGKARFNGRLGWLIEEGAHLLGFHDLEPWPRAVRQLLTDFEVGDSCPVCYQQRQF